MSGIEEKEDAMNKYDRRTRLDILHIPAEY